VTRSAKKGLEERSASVRRSVCAVRCSLGKRGKPTVLLEVGLAGGDELQGDKLEAALGLASVWAGSGRWMFLTRGSRSGQ
jgi:hypothetical protein